MVGEARGMIVQRRGGVRGKDKIEYGRFGKEREGE